MAELNFADRVAVITGAGRGLGRAYALLLAQRGAKVLVNDYGTTLQGGSNDISPAQSVVDEIHGFGGQAVANIDNVATPEGGRNIIDAAICRFGKIDILIHNAGIVRRAMLAEMSYEEFESVLDVHLRGAFHVLRPAFPVMCKAGYGRVVLTGSINALYGNQGALNYSTAKAGILGLTKVAALEGAEHGVLCNAILPVALTRMAEGIDTRGFPPMAPEQVAPAVAWLCHQHCSISGEMLISAAGRVARAYSVETPGAYQQEWTIEDIANRQHAILHAETPLEFPVLPSGHRDHLQYSFGMATHSTVPNKS